MKLTMRDVEEVVKSSSQIGADTTAEPTLVTSDLLALLVKSSDYQCLIRELPMHVLMESIKAGKTDQFHILGTLAQMGVLSGIAIGFQLGMREAGLELGIGGATSAPASKE